jgi:CheY-like chemotaxis protein
MRILVVDDDGAIRDSVRVTLEYEGYQVVAASNGLEGLALVEQEVPDLVLLDVRMPGLGGLEVLGRLTAMHKYLPVVMMSAQAKSAIREEVLRAGAVELLDKPFETDELRTIIHSALEERVSLGEIASASPEARR